MTIDCVGRGLRVAAAALGLALVCSAASGAQGGKAARGDTEAAPGEEAAPVDGAGPADAAEAEAFFDGLLGAQLRHLKDVGATVSLVRDGEILFAKGYGLADLESGTRVDADKTLFRIGSVSKLFVWTAVMQLVEEGRLDLDADINEYLEEIEIPATWDRPITLANLMTHTPGFEDRVLGLFSRREEDLVPVAEALARQLPARVRPPGEQPSYSNHGTAMAALIVETVAGQPFHEFVQERILDPLGMENTTLLQPLPEGLAGQMSKGYSRAGDHFEEKEFELVPLYPAGSTSASATDMARLMIAFLQNGRFGDSRILEEATAREMRSPLLEVDPAVNPSPHGLMDMSTRGIRIVGHGGDTLWFHTLFALFPDHDLGLFVSYNTDKGGGGRGPLLEAVLDRYFAPAERPSEPPEGFTERADAYTGEFRPNRFAHTTLARLGALAGTFEVEVNDEGELMAFDTRFVETAPRVFTERNGERRLVFIEGDDGRMSHFYNAQFPIVTFERVPLGERRWLHLPVAALACAALLATILAWPLGWAVRQWFGVEYDPSARIPRSARLALWAAAVLLLAMVAGVAIDASDPTDLVFGELGTIKALLVLPLVALIPAAMALVATVGIWRRGRGTRSGRVAYTLSAVLVVVFYWQLAVWNLLGFKL
jgi:CubicO group peptidase (beta-lactamase class C family)